MSEAWFCPACQKHHAPHVETCPVGGEGTVQRQPDGVLDAVWKPNKRKTETKIRLCPECGLPPGQCDPDGVGHYRG